MSGVTDKLGGPIAQQNKLIAQSGIGFCFPVMHVVDFLPKWAEVHSFHCVVHESPPLGPLLVYAGENHR